MRQPQGSSIVTGPGTGAGESDTYTCAHCNCVRFVKPMCPPDEMPNVCHLCGDKHRPSFVCERPECNVGCDPFEEKLRRIERRAHYMAEWV